MKSDKISAVAPLFTDVKTGQYTEGKLQWQRYSSCEARLTTNSSITNLVLISEQN